MNIAILATGPSLTQAQADAVRSAFTVIAISDAIRLAPWADALVSADAAWWNHHRPDFAGRRLCAQKIEGCDRINGASGICSGALAIRVAREMGAKLIVLLGYDGHGTHFFGKHPEPLKNTSETRRLIHAEQLESESRECAATGIKVLNATPGTALRCFARASIEDVA